MLRGYLYRKLIEKRKEETVKKEPVRKEEKPQKEKQKEKEQPEAKKPKKELYNVHENPSLFAGIILGLMGGILGNVLVLSARDFIDSISAGNSWIIFLAALGGFIVVIWFLLSKLRMVMYR